MKIMDTIANKNIQKFNPFQNRTIFCFIPVILCWYMAIHYHAMYQTCDDMDMRILLEGSVGGKVSAPSEFTLYMNVLYGKFLKIFYTIYQDGYWYDIFTYLFVSLALYTITLSLCKEFDTESLLSKLIKLITVTFAGATPFISPQFTLTSGMLAISGVLAFYMWVDGYFSSLKSNALCCIYCFTALLFSSLIRFECCMVVAFFTGILLLPSWPYKEWKMLAKKSTLCVTSLAVILGAYFLDGYIVGKNPEWDEMRKANAARVEIADKTNMWDNINTPWKDTEAEISNNNLKNFTSADYRMLLTSYFFIDNEVIKSKNLASVAKAIGDKVQKFNTMSAGFRIKDYRDVFQSFAFLALILTILSAQHIKKSIYYCVVFILFVITLNVEFRALPYRLWYNFAFATLCLLLMRFVNIKHDSKIYKIICLISVIFISPLAYKIMHNQANSTQYQYFVYKNMQKNIDKLPTDNLYLCDFAIEEHACAPFRKNILKNIIVLTPLNIHSENLKFIEQKIGPYKNIWDKAIEKNSTIKFLLHYKVYMDAWVAIKKSLPFYIREKYGSEVIWSYSVYGDFIVAKPIILASHESEMRKSYQREIASLSISNDVKRIMQVDFVRQWLGPDATFKEVADALLILNGEMIEE